jgi:hypothetical protein
MQAAPQDAGPQVPKTQLELTARLIKLTGLIKEAKNARAMAQQTGTAMYERALQNVVKDPDYRKPPMGLISHWPQAVHQLNRVNQRFNPSRKMDLENFREMNNALYKAPRQDSFGDDNDARAQYHSLFFLVKHVLAQADLLIAQMEEEAKGLLPQITNAEALSAVEASK